MLQYEKELTGVYISGHPLDDFSQTLDTLPHNTAYVAELLQSDDGGLSEDAKPVKMGGMITALQAKSTKKGSMMGFLTLEDLTGQIECILFPKVWERFGHELSIDMAVIAQGKLSIREDEETKLLVDNIQALQELNIEKEITKEPSVLAKKAPVKLYLKLLRSQMEDCEQILKPLHGKIPVYLHLHQEKVTLLAPENWWCQDADKAKDKLLVCLPAENIKVVINR